MNIITHYLHFAIPTPRLESWFRSTTTWFLLAFLLVPAIDAALPFYFDSMTPLVSVNLESDRVIV